ncbi:MAG: hypothetical protein KA715_03080 [Xanthomonadaceae bacterium]|nr:hypothetical protein [Xanthomonadaceae bacterium]
MESKTSVVIKLGLVAAISLFLSAQSYSQDSKTNPVVTILKLSSTLTIDPANIQSTSEGEFFVAYQFLKPANEGLIPDKPYCNLWIKKDISARAKLTHTSLALDPKYVMLVKEKPVFYKGLLESSIQYKLDHKWFSELYCKNVSKLDSTKDIFGVVFTESKARRMFSDKTKIQRKISTKSKALKKG